MIRSIKVRCTEAHEFTKTFLGHINFLACRARFPREQCRGIARRCRRTSLSFMIIQIVTTEERVYAVVLFPSYAKPPPCRSGRGVPRRVHAKESFTSATGQTAGKREAELFPLAVLLHLMANQRIVAGPRKELARIARVQCVYVVSHAPSRVNAQGKLIH